MKIHTDILYSKHHLWVRKISETTFESGITDYAQDLLGDIVFVEYPTIGAQLQKDVACGLVESVKTGSDLHAPLTGVVTALNQKLESHPENINDEPYKAWIFKFEATNLAELANLLNSQDYNKMIN